MMTGSPRPRPRVLIVASDASLTTNLRQQLDGLGFELVGTVSGAEDAMAQVASLQPTVALVDAALPSAPGGVEIARALQEAFWLHDAHPLAVVLLTTPVAYEAMVGSGAARPIATLVAPFARHHLRTIIDMTLLVEEGVRERRRTGAQMRLQGVALEAAVNSVVITDTAGRIVWVNQAFCNITGYTRDEAVGQNPRLLKSGRQSPEYYASMWRTVTAGRSWQGEFVNRRKDGSLYTEDVAITPVTDESGAVTHYIAIKQDTTELKQSLAALETAHAEVSRKNAALDAALVEARAAVEAKAAFLATMSHEIRTPMNGVIGMASLLRESRPLTEQQHDYIETIRLSGETLLTVINDVLDFSKVESGRMEIERIAFDLRRCVDQTLETLGPRAREKRLVLAADIDASVPPLVVGDRVRLRQVLTNLVGNAVKFTHTGEVIVELRAEPRPDGQQRVCVRVRDTGIGIPDDKRDRLFRPFSQVDSSTTRLYGGTGLGLAISQRLVGLMGGTIEVASMPGIGSIFSFDIVLPTARVVEPTRPSTVALELDGHTSISGGDNATGATAAPRILLAEDNPVNRKVALAMLKRLGLTADTAADGEAAVEACRTTAYDVVLMDVQMPELDGLQATREVRALPGRRPRIVAMTAHAMAGDRDACLAAGMDDYVSKPVSLDDLRRVLGLTIPSSSSP